MSNCSEAFPYSNPSPSISPLLFWEPALRSYEGRELEGEVMIESRVTILLGSTKWSNSFSPADLHAVFAFSMTARKLRHSLYPKSV